MALLHGAIGIGEWLISWLCFCWTGVPSSGGGRRNLTPLTATLYACALGGTALTVAALLQRGGVDLAAWSLACLGQLSCFLPSVAQRWPSPDLRMRSGTWGGACFGLHQSGAGICGTAGSGAADEVLALGVMAEWSAGHCRVWLTTAYSGNLEKTHDPQSGTEMIRDAMRDFAQSASPLAGDWDRHHTFRRGAEELGALGAMGVVVPEEWDGAGMDYHEPGADAGKSLPATVPPRPLSACRTHWPVASP